MLPLVGFVFYVSRATRGQTPILQKSSVFIFEVLFAPPTSPPLSRVLRAGHASLIFSSSQYSPLGPFFFSNVELVKKLPFSFSFFLRKIVCFFPYPYSLSDTPLFLSFFPCRLTQPDSCVPPFSDGCMFQ